MLIDRDHDLLYWSAIFFAGTSSSSLPSYSLTSLVYHMLCVSIRLHIHRQYCSNGVYASISYQTGIHHTCAIILIIIISAMTMNGVCDVCMIMMYDHVCDMMV